MTANNYGKTSSHKKCVWGQENFMAMPKKRDLVYELTKIILIMIPMKFSKTQFLLKLHKKNHLRSSSRLSTKFYKHESRAIGRYQPIKCNYLK